MNWLSVKIKSFKTICIVVFVVNNHYSFDPYLTMVQSLNKDVPLHPSWTLIILTSFKKKFVWSIQLINSVYVILLG